MKTIIEAEQDLIETLKRNFREESNLSAFTAEKYIAYLLLDGWKLRHSDKTDTFLYRDNESVDVARKSGDFFYHRHNEECTKVVHRELHLEGIYPWALRRIIELWSVVPMDAE